MEELIKEIRKASFNYINQHPAMNLNQEVVRLADVEEIISNRLEKLVMPKIAEELDKFSDYLRQQYGGLSSDYETKEEEARKEILEQVIRMFGVTRANVSNFSA